MKLSLAEAATVLGKTERQVRYLIKTGRLPAEKEGRRWWIESADLPLSERQRQALGERHRAAREAFDKGLEPIAKAAEPAAKKHEKKRGYSVTDLVAFSTGEEIYRQVSRQLGADDPAPGHLFAALALVARGCHCYHPADKAGRFTEARELAATAVAELLLHSEPEDAPRRALAERIEQELIPKLAGLVASHEKRSRRGRFDRFASAAAR